MNDRVLAPIIHSQHELTKRLLFQDLSQCIGVHQTPALLVSSTNDNDSTSSADDITTPPAPGSKKTKFSGVIASVSGSRIRWSWPFFMCNLKARNGRLNRAPRIS